MFDKEKYDSFFKQFSQEWDKPKHLDSKINGETQMTQNDLILKSNAKAHRW